jgi:hypothetical protein
MRISTRSCLDNDTFSKLFWILELPERTGLCKMDWDWVITRAFCISNRRMMVIQQQTWPPVAVTQQAANSRGWAALLTEILAAFSRLGKTTPM